MERYKALIVDDEEMIARGIARMVAACGEGWEVVGTMADGQEALDFIQRHEGDIDLLITDVKMPEMDGLTLINELNRDHDLYFLIISGYDDFHYVKTAMREGALDYLLKPIDREQLRERMTEIREKIEEKRRRQMRWLEMERKSEQLQQSRQIQLLSYVTSAGLDITRLGYWVEEFPKGCSRLLYFSLDALPHKAKTFNAKDWGAFDYVVERIIAESAAEAMKEHRGRYWCWRGEQSDVWAMLQLPKLEDEEALADIVHQTTDKIRAAVREYTPFTISAAVSDSFHDLYMLPEAARQVKQLMYYRWISGGNRSFISQIDRQSADSEVHTEETELLQIGQRICEAVEQASGEAARRWMRELFAKLEQMKSPLIIQRCMQVLYLSLQMAGSEQELDEEAMEDGLRAIKRAPNLQAIRHLIEQLVRSRLQVVKSYRRSASHGPIEQAKAWIAVRLHEEISIKQIADHVYMSPSYFCRYFKMHTGETILDYITRQRMEKAKSLLADPGFKIQEISLMVGYQDVKYFSRLFKRWTGETPTRYRCQVLYT